MIQALITALVLLLGTTAVTMRRHDAHRPRHALGAADDLRGWPETLAEIRRSLEPTTEIEPVAWVPPEVIELRMDPSYLFTHRRLEEVPSGS
jgi:hypothetical protein